ncbi:aminoglycoside O-phosphotransferase APH(2'')-IIIa [Jeotgalibacillus sp. S-D1]|uniref:phosphotransferase family protein n=1 Tax=Jeotgalibacillus sp. S-D1 TaxID=2552189 RepID=UPI0010592ED5|nr:phosphotransferase [Jeotgalibacillus sp. S-D1]TDL32718.1 aminoglycoside O-phosphotransferase APH(2'')-IIIa [Jeotgalibacillus sp. S-D1]
MKPAAMEFFTNNIKRNFPDFTINKVEILGEGQMSVALKVNDSWVFRFPKNAAGSVDLEKEITMLPLLSPHITAAIPQFTYIGKQQNGFYFTGYPLLPGVILEEEGFEALPADKKNHLIDQLAGCIREVRSFPVDVAKQAGVPQFDPAAVFTELHKVVLEQIFPLLDKRTQNYVSSRFKAYFTNPHYKEYIPALIHADLSPDHYLVDPKSSSLTGIIDFGDLRISDPDYEYLYILEDCGMDFTSKLLAHSGEIHIKERLMKISLFVTFDHLQYVLQGINQGNKAWIQEGLDEIKREMEF